MAHARQSPRGVAATPVFEQISGVPGAAKRDSLSPVPPQNLVDRTIVDVSTLGVRLANPMVHLLHVLLATARSSLRPQHGSVISSMTLRSMNSSESDYRGEPDPFRLTRTRSVTK
jgi:hypothetical protein